MLEDLFDDLFPITRSITGPGLRETLELLRTAVPLKIERVPTGTEVFDWEVPEEWRIHEAYLDGPDGERIVNFDDSNLHVVNYSESVDVHLSFLELKDHLYADESVPDATSYVTSYYDRKWGFCLPHNTYESLPDGASRHSSETPSRILVLETASSGIPQVPVGTGTC